jgi:hypothetical protein
MDNKKAFGFFDKRNANYMKWGVPILGLITFAIFQDQIIKLMENLIYLGIMGGFVILVIVIVTSPAGRAGYNTFMRALTQFFVQINPIGLMYDHIDDMTDRVREMMEKLGELKKSMGVLEGRYRKNEQTIKGHQAKANQRSKDTDKRARTDAKVAMAAVGTLSASNKKLAPIIKQTNLLYQKLDDISIQLGAGIKIMTLEVKETEIQYEILKKAHSILESAVELINGETASGDLYLLAMDHVEQHMNEMVGEIDRFLETATDFLINAESDQTANMEAGLNEMGDMASKSLLDMLTPPTVDQVAANLAKGKEPLDLGAISKPAASSSSAGLNFKL